MFSRTVAHHAHPNSWWGGILGPTNRFPKHHQPLCQERYFGCLESRAPKSLFYKKTSQLTRKFRAHPPYQVGPTTEAILETVWQEHVPVQSLPVFFGLTGLPWNPVLFAIKRNKPWLKQPIWKICSSTWIISEVGVEKKQIYIFFLRSMAHGVCKNDDYPIERNPSWPHKWKNGANLAWSRHHSQRLLFGTGWRMHPGV